jgi:two-component system, NarL family, sensor histidine kinase DesK
MGVDVDARSAADAQWAWGQRRWTRGWRRTAVSAIFLIYLVYVIQAVSNHSRGVAAVGGYVVIGIFGACWLFGIRVMPSATGGQRWALYGVLVALSLAELPFAHETGFVMWVYVTAMTVVLLGLRATPVVLALALVALVVPLVIPSWHDGLGGAVDTAAPIPVVALVTFGVLQVFRGNQALADARAELARLTAENERTRIARDLHDLLGHSLTTITVKAGLATQLGETDTSRALEEIAEVESLARRALGEVRAAVASYRQVTLAGELAAGRVLLRAAGITAELPYAVDSVDPAHQELFGWVVREGLTNVVRHAKASTCTVQLDASSVVIVDDGVGADGTGSTGSGLAGLRERVAAAGGTIDAGPVHPQGWRLRVTAPPQPSSR